MIWCWALRVKQCREFAVSIGTARVQRLPGLGDVEVIKEEMESALVPEEVFEQGLALVEVVLPRVRLFSKQLNLR